MYTQEKYIPQSQNYAWKSKSPLKYSTQHLQTMLETDSQYVQDSQFCLQCSNRWLLLWVSSRWRNWLAFEAILYKKCLSLKIWIILCTVRSSYCKVQSIHNRLRELRELLMFPFVCHVKDQTQDFTHVKQVLKHISRTNSSFRGGGVGDTHLCSESTTSGGA